MTYVNIVTTVCNVLSLLLGALFLHYVIFAIAGILKKKTYPKTEKQNRFGVVVSARNEEHVIAALVESIQKNDYPKELVNIFVVAHNCTDRTAKIARQAGATVYEYNNPDEATKGFALKYLFKCIERDYGIMSFDAFFLFDADNLLSTNYISKMNDAFEYYGRKSVITSYRNSKNFGYNVMSGLYGLLFAMGSRIESRGRTVLDCTTRIMGTGALIYSETLKKGWDYVTLTEDLEFSTDEVLRGHDVKYCDEAIFYDEQPTSVKIMFRQRLRWCRGRLLVFYQRSQDLFRGFLKKDQAKRISAYDLWVYTLPTPLFGLILQFVQFVLLFLAPLIVPGVSLSEILFGNGDLLTSNGILLGLARSGIITYIGAFLSAFGMYLIERKRIPRLGVGRRILLALVWPFFLGVELFIYIGAFFAKNLSWKPIPHKDKTKIEDVHAAK